MLDIQQPFKLGDVTVSPQKDEISLDGNTIEIKSMAMKVLCYFASNPDQVISRDNLRDNVWQNSTASNHTINNHIYSLRQTLAKLAPEDKYLHTVTGSQSGYRLIAEVSQTPQNKSDETDLFISASTQTEDGGVKHETHSQTPKDLSENTSKQTLYVKVIYGFVGLFILLVLNYIFSMEKSYNQTTKLTLQEGREQSPAISHNGEIVIYSNRTDSSSTWELYASKMQTPLKPIKVFKGVRNNDNFVSISPQNKYIAFHRHMNAFDGIYVADFNTKNLTASNDKLVIPLNAINFSPAISWLNESQFFYTAQEATSAPLKIYLYDLALDRSEPISAPPINTFGDFALMVSPNKKWLAIMRADELNGHRLHLYNIETKKLISTDVVSAEERLNISFSDDSEHIHYVDEEGYLSSYHIKNKLIKTISTEQYLGYWPLKVPGKPLFIMQQDWGYSSQTTQVIKINNPIKGGDGKSTVLIHNGLSIRSIEGIDNDGLIFASIKPNHHVELWKYQGGQSTKLDEFHEVPQYRYPLSLHWLKNTNTALLSINKSCRLVDIRTGKDTPLCPADEIVYAGRFSNDGQSIFLPGFERDQESAIQMGITGHPVTRFSALNFANSIQENEDGSFYYSHETSFDIYYFNPQTNEEIQVINRTYVNNRYSVNDFVVTKQGIYFMDRVDVGENAIFYYNFDNKNTVFVTDSKDNYPNIVLSEDELSIYLIESVVNNTSLLLID